MSQYRVGYLIKLISNKLRAKADANLRQHNLTLVQSGVLLYLGKHGGKAPQKEIEEYLGVSHATVCGLISRMERNGHLRTFTDTKDRRIRIVSLTDQAKAITAHLDSNIQQNEKAMLNGLDENQIQQLQEYLTIILNNIDP